MIDFSTSYVILNNNMEDFLNDADKLHEQPLHKHSDDASEANSMINTLSSSTKETISNNVEDCLTHRRLSMN